MFLKQEYILLSAIDENRGKNILLFKSYFYVTPTTMRDFKKLQSPNNN